MFALWKEVGPGCEGVVVKNLKISDSFGNLLVNLLVIVSAALLAESPTLSDFSRSHFSSLLYLQLVNSCFASTETPDNP